MQNGKGAPDHFQNSGNMNNATEWKCRWLGKIQCTGILNENVTKKEWKWPGKMHRTGILRKKKKKMTRKDATYRDLVKIFKSWQVCDWLAKWIIMLRFMDLRWPRVFRRSNVGLVWLCSHHRIMKFSGVINKDNSKVHAKGQGQRSNVKVTEVTTQLNRFRTETPVWIHIWWWHDAYSLMMLRRGALLFFTRGQFWPSGIVVGCVCLSVCLCVR